MVNSGHLESGSGGEANYRDTCFLGVVPPSRHQGATSSSGRVSGRRSRVGSSGLRLMSLIKVKSVPSEVRTTAALLRGHVSRPALLVVQVKLRAGERRTAGPLFVHMQSVIGQTKGIRKKIIIIYKNSIFYGLTSALFGIIFIFHKAFFKKISKYDCTS